MTSSSGHWTVIEHEYINVCIRLSDLCCFGSQDAVGQLVALDNTVLL